MPRTTTASQEWLYGLMCVCCLGTTTCFRIWNAVRKGLARGD